MSNVAVRTWLFFIISLLGTLPAHAELILSSAPRDTKEKEEAIFKPIVELLGKVSGEKVVFRYGDNQLTYQSEMRKGAYDIAFDGPAFAGWRITALNHMPLVKFPGNLSFVAFVKNDQDRLRDLKDLAGRRVCAFAPPNLATLVVLAEFDNPSRQPLIIEVQSFQGAYKGVLEGKCAAGIMQAKLHQESDKDTNATRVLFKSKPLPNQAFTAGPRVTPDAREKMTKALLSPEGAEATQKLRDVFKVPALLPAAPDEFQGLGRLLRDTYGFEH